MRAASLHQAQFDSPRFEARLFLDDVGERGRYAAELRMAEAVARAFGNEFADELTVFVVNAFGNDGDALVVVLRADGFHVFDKLIHAEGDFGQIDKVGAEPFRVGELRRGGQPAGVTAHRLDDAHHRGIVNFGVEVDFHDRGGDVSRRARVAGAVIGAVQVVIDGLGHADDVAFVTGLLQVLGNFIAGIHGIVAAVIHEKTHVIFFEYFQNSLVVGIVHRSVFQLITHRAERRRRRIFQKFEFFSVLFADIVKIFVQNAFDSVRRAVNGGDRFGIERFEKYARGTAVDDGRRTARLRKH